MIKNIKVGNSLLVLIQGFKKVLPSELVLKFIPLISTILCMSLSHLSSDFPNGLRWSLGFNSSICPSSPVVTGEQHGLPLPF